MTASGPSRDAAPAVGDDVGTAAATFCATLVDEWTRAGVAHAVVSPGSRSTPLALALADDERIRVHVHHDERAAGFLALGIAKITGVPSVVLTTSGTAAVELHPAVVEAHHARVPLLVCTADRPARLQDVGAPQTIDQTHLYGSAVRFFAEPGVPRSADATAWRALAARSVLEAVGSPPGPVQLNLAFDEPLVAAPGALPAGRDGARPWLSRPDRSAMPTSDEIDALVVVLRDAGSAGVIVAGEGVLSSSGVHELAELLGWPVLADPLSGCRTPSEHTVSHADALLRIGAFVERVRPQVVVRLGRLHASKVLNGWLSSCDAWQVGVDLHGQIADPDHVLDAVVRAEPGRLCSELARRVVQSAGPAPVRDPHDLLALWSRADACAAEAFTETLAARSELSEPRVARDVIAGALTDTTIVVSSSMPIRDVEWYSAPRDDVTVVANRGANGIDGVVSSAVGVALGSQRPVVVLVGDVALLHDTNALLGLRGRGVDLTVVVVDNDGGGIFSFLAQARALDHERFEALFGTPHAVDFIALGAAHGLEVQEVVEPNEVLAAVSASVARGGVRLLVVRTDRSSNVAIHDALHTAVAQRVAGLLEHTDVVAP